MLICYVCSMNIENCDMIYIHRKSNKPNSRVVYSCSKSRYVVGLEKDALVMYQVRINLLDRRCSTILILKHFFFYIILLENLCNFNLSMLTFSS